MFIIVSVGGKNTQHTAAITMLTDTGTDAVRRRGEDGDGARRVVKVDYVRVPTLPVLR